MKKRFYYISILLLIAPPCLAQTTTELWKQVELKFESKGCYGNPFLEVELFAEFTSKTGKIIKRPAFWDGGNLWKIRFAPTQLGKWQYKLSGKNLEDFSGQKCGYINAVQYKGNLPIYKNGFLKISKNKRYLTYANGKPFFYLADTHWFLPLEKWDECNEPDCKSQFKFMVDYRSKQGFTVYQTQTNGIKLVEDSVYSVDIKAFQDIDRKFDYIASKGLVINTSIGSAHNFALVLGIKGAERLANYWVARYGAYPLLWMTGQEIDLDKHKYLEVWKAAANTLCKNDDYQHPLSAHLWDNSNPQLLNNEKWHAFHMIQGGHIIWGGGTQTKDFYKKFYTANPIKPILESEANYEGLGKEKKCTTEDIRNAAYKSILCGSFGFGYGVQGIWQNCITSSDCGCCKEWGTITWYEGLKMDGGAQMSFLNNFFTSIKWTKLIPRFDECTWIEIDCDNTKEREKVVLATISNDQYFLYLYSDKELPVRLKNLNPDKRYTAKWFNPRNGKFVKINLSPRIGSTSWTIPPKPSNEDYILILS